MSKVLVVLRYLPYFIQYCFKQIPYYFYQKNHSEIENYEYAYEISRDHCRKILKALKVEPIVYGLENIPKDENIVYISNHLSLLDVVMLCINTPRTTVFLAKEEFKKWPVFGKWFIRMSGVLLNRDDPREGLKSINETVRRINELGFDAAIYPEGTRSKSRVTEEFHKGSFKIAQKAKVKIQPVAIQDTYKAVEDGPFKLGVPMYISFLEPIDISNLDKEQNKTIHEDIRLLIDTEAKKLREISDNRK